jgi:hypothetical protein
MSNNPKSVDLPPDLKSNHPRKRKKIIYLDDVNSDKICKTESTPKNIWKFKIPKKEKNNATVTSALGALRQDHADDPPLDKVNPPEKSNSDKIHAKEVDDRPKLKPCPKSKRTQPTPSSYDIKPADKNKSKFHVVQRFQEAAATSTRSIFEPGDSIDFRDFLADPGCPVTSTPPRNQNNTLPSKFLSHGTLINDVSHLVGARFQV